MPDSSELTVKCLETLQKLGVEYKTTWDRLENLEMGIGPEAAQFRDDTTARYQLQATLRRSLRDLCLVMRQWRERLESELHNLSSTDSPHHHIPVVDGEGGQT